MESSTAEFLERRLAFELLPMSVLLENSSELKCITCTWAPQVCAMLFWFVSAMLATHYRSTLSNHRECDTDDHTFSVFWL